MKRTPLRRVGRIGKEYQATRQAFLASKGHGHHPCECEDKECWRWVDVFCAEGTWGTDGDVDHHQSRSRRPDLRNDPGNLRLLHKRCHRVRKHGGTP